jgi:outer membrane protein assembly factor BamD
MPKTYRFALIILLLTSLVGGCSLLEDEDETLNWTAEMFLQAAREQAKGEYWEEAITYYRKLQGRFPYGVFSEQAQLEIAYVYYKSNRPALAIAEADRFIQMHPVHANVDYAYYLKGLAGFKPERGFLSAITGSDPSAHDTGPVRDAFDAYRELVTRFPNSTYAPDAKKRLVEIVNVLAMHDVQIARYYHARGAHVAALNRAKQVLETYQTSSAAEHALEVMIEAYKEMGLAELGHDAERVLRLNYPHSSYLPENH